MKSIVEEASSIFKAIEKAWYTAGKPEEFSVKILEEAQKNFIGLTTRSAKIAIIFPDKKVQSKAQPPKTTKTEPIKKQLRIIPPKPPLETSKEAAKPKQPPKPPSENIRTSTIKEEIKKASELVMKPNQPIWTEPMVQTAQEWLVKTLSYVSDVPLKFTIEPQHYHLKIKLEKPLFKEINRQKQFFASLTTLMLQMLKNKYKRPLRGYKIVIATD